MNHVGSELGFLKALTWTHVALVAATLAGCILLVKLVRTAARHAAERAPPRQRLMILRITPVARLLIGVAGLVIIIPLLVEPNFEDIIALLAAIGLAVAFAIKDYVSCLIAGLVTIIENTYQPGDWIEFDGAAGEVKTIGTRAVYIVTADQTEVIIPHAKIWTTSVSNESSGKPGLLCVTHFYPRADHDGDVVVRAMTEVAETSPYRDADAPVTVGAAETPFGTHYKLKAHVAKSCDRFAMVTDLTLRTKAQLRALGIAFAQTSYVETET
jgi:small conductance mechanosensitive channel